MKYVALILALGFTPLAFSKNTAEDFEPEALIEYRQDTMTAIKGHNNAIKAIVNGKVPYDDHLDTHLTALETLFSRIP